MATDNTDASVIYFPGEANSGHHPGGTASVALPASRFVLATFTATSTVPPVLNGNPNLVKFVNADLAWYNGTSWILYTAT